jgi:RNA polymerase sigma-70 factor (ECF subfamily)
LVPADRPAPAASAWSDQVRLTYLEVRAPLWRALVAWSGEADVADDAVAEAFAQLLRRGDEVVDPAAWVWRAAFRVAAGDLQQRRGRARRGAAPEALELLPSTTDRLPDEALDLVSALRSLTDQQRRCVALVDVAGHTAPTAAEILGTSAATVRVQLMRARRQLRTLLADSPLDPGATSGGPEIHPETRP